MLKQIGKGTAMKTGRLAAFLALALALAGCGGNGSSPSAGAGASGGTAASESAAASPQAGRTELTVSAAASLTDALNEIKAAYEAGHPNVKLTFNFGGSGTLQQQIEQGAPADLFLSAADKNMQALVDKKLVEEDKTTELLQNELVVVVPAEGGSGVAGIADLAGADVKKVAIGIPDSVPAGSYAREALTNAGLWDKLQAKTVQAKDVRQVLQYVETGNADAGFVYRTDALTSQKVKVAFAVDPSAYTKIEYPIGIVKASKHAKEAEDLYNYLQSPEALDVFVKYGFSVPK